MRRSRFKPRKVVKVGRRVRKRRGVSVRANAKATRALFESAGIADAGKATVRSVLSLSASRLDDVELDTAIKAALRGDYETASSRLARSIQPVKSSKKKPKGWSPWRNPILARRK